MARSNKPATPEDVPSASSLPSGDYGFTFDLAMQMQLTLGKVIEAVESLKTDSREQRAELKEQSAELKAIGTEIHAAKVGLRWVVGVCVAFGGIIGWAVNAYTGLVRH